MRSTRGRALIPMASQQEPQVELLRAFLDGDAGYKTLLLALRALGVGPLIALQLNEIVPAKSKVHSDVQLPDNDSVLIDSKHE
jgi:hypothetical protein